LGRYGTGRPAHIADLVEMLGRLAQVIERKTRREWDRDRRTAECLIRAFVGLVAYHNKAIAPPRSAPDDPGMVALQQIILDLEYPWDELMPTRLPGLYTPYLDNADVLRKIQRNFMRRHK
jgi:hypothetical protein